jgi:hypothetical protein
MDCVLGEMYCGRRVAADAAALFRGKRMTIVAVALPDVVPLCGTLATGAKPSRPPPLQAAIANDETAKTAA